jgi:hypothetical protein
MWIKKKQIAKKNYTQRLQTRVQIIQNCSCDCCKKNMNENKKKKEMLRYFLPKNFILYQKLYVKTVKKLLKNMIINIMN